MNPAFHRVKEIFLASLERQAPSERAAYLAEACGADESLRRQVEALLRQHEQAGSFLENPPAGEAEATSDLPRGRVLSEEDLASPPQEGPGTRIGPYKLLQQIGEGGMGVVHLAEQQEPVRRQVALKVVKAGMDSAQVLARFEQERQALALMDHPHIAKVLDAGTTASGRPYFVMELVKGTPITRYSDEHRLTPRQRLELFVPVCQAIQHAHQKGIIHRDIKPSNVLVAPYDGQPVVKVIDFGVAKAAGQRLTERTLFTEIGAVLGTLEYMSPEQAELNNQDIDTRSDIYSLGVLLYQMLTGTTPLTRDRLKQAAFTEMLRLIREEEPPKPSTRLSESKESLPSVSAQRQMEPAKLTRLVRGELDWIVMKALEKDRTRRYETANGLARDLERYLADEPVEACPPSAGYRLRKYARKHRRLLATAAAFTLLLLVGAVLSTWQAVRATQAEALARREESKARTAAEAEAVQRQEAEANFAKARAAVDHYLTKVSESWLLNVPGLQPLRRELLTSALVFYQDFLQQRGEDPGLRAALAAAQFRVGRIYEELGDREASHTAMMSALAMYEELSQVQPDDIDLRISLARCYLCTGAPAKAIERWEKLLAAAPNNARYQKELADAYQALASQHRDKDKAATLAAYGRQRRANGTVDLRIEEKVAALAAHQQALALRSNLVRNDPDNVQARRDLGQTLNGVAEILLDKGLLSEGVPSSDVLAMYYRFVEHTEKALAEGSDRLHDGRGLVIAYGNIALMERGLGRSAQALPWYRKSADLAKRLAQENPAVASLQSDCFNCYRELATYQRELGQAEQAAAGFRLASEVLERLPRQSAEDVYNLACVLARASAVLGESREKRTPEDEAEGRRLADQALDALRRTMAAGFKAVDRVRADKDLDTLRPRADFQELLTVAERAGKEEALTKATADAAAAARKTQQAVLANQLDLAAGENAIGQIQMNLGQYEAAARSLAQALELREALLRDDPADARYQADLALTRLALGWLDWKTGRHVAAVPKLRLALEAAQALASRLPGDDLLQQQLAQGFTDVAHLYARGGLWQEAARYLTQAVQQLPNEHWQAYCLAHLLAQTGDLEGYRRLCRDMLERFGKRRDPSSSPRAGQAALLLPDAVADHYLLTRLAEFGVQEASSGQRGQRQVARGITAYRNGQFAVAVSGIEEGLNGNAMGFYRVKGYCFLAMAHHQLGQADAARTALNQARAELRRHYPQPDREDLGNGWRDWLSSQLFRREAETLIEGTTTTDPLEHLHRAKLYAQLGEMDKADSEFAAAVAVRPNDPEVWMMRGRIFAQVGLQERSAADFARARELKPLLSGKPES
jgi:serine/threonine protein kinase/tetratricopeptide (TPR) repeat protein